MAFGSLVEKPQGAENSALKKTAPVSFTSLKTAENASISQFGLSSRFDGSSAKELAQPGRLSKRSGRSGMVVLAAASHDSIRQARPAGAPTVNVNRRYRSEG
jgi:hypothetical protein